MTSTKEKNPKNGRASLSLTHEEIEAVFLANGRDFKKTSEATGIKLNTLYVIAKRKGFSTANNAIRKIQEGKKELEAIQPEIVKSVKEALVNTLERDKEVFMHGISGGISKAAGVIGDMSGGEVLANSRDLKNLVDAGKVLYQLGSESNAPSVSINLLNMDASSLISVKR